MRRAFSILASLFALVVSLRADPAGMEAKFRQLPAGTAVIDPAAPLTLTGQGGAIERVSVEGQPFPEAVREEITAP